MVARQQDEARLLAQLNHDHIVKVIDMSEVHGRPALLMEYVEGVDGHTLRQQGPLPVAAALEIVQATASALDAAWNTPSTLTGQPLRVIPRDIKPSNLLISRYGGLKVLDFGVARANFDREGTTTSMQYGTARFMAPEQWLSGAVSHTVDIYALGVSAFELLTGNKFQRLPLQPDRFQQGLLERSTALDLRSQHKPVQAAIRALLIRMLSYDPEDRPTASEVRDQCISILLQADGDSVRMAWPSAACSNEPVPPTSDGPFRLCQPQPRNDSQRVISVVESHLRWNPTPHTLNPPIADLPRAAEYRQREGNPPDVDNVVLFAGFMVGGVRLSQIPIISSIRPDSPLLLSETLYKPNTNPVDDRARIRSQSPPKRTQKRPQVRPSNNPSPLTRAKATESIQDQPRND